MTALCSVSDCARARQAHGYCGMHAQRFRRHGDPLYVGPRRRPHIEQFWAKVQRATEHECWLWHGERQKEGYGRTRLKPTASGSRLAHRVAYELLAGEIPAGSQLDHLCRNPPCVNPAHLEPVSPRENTARGLHGALRTHCRNGHELTPENVYVIEADRSRRCRTCSRDAARRERREPVKAERRREGTRRWRARQRAALAGTA